MNRPLSTPAIRIAPSILAANFACLEREITEVTADPDPAARADLIHFDVMDGHFVPNISLGVPVIKACRRISNAFFDVHLMISDPIRYAEPFIHAGADLISFHVELIDAPQQILQTVRQAADRAGRPCQAGVVLNPHTDLRHVWPVLEQVDLVLLMSVFPGFGGQRFIDDVLHKAEELAPRLRPDQRLEIDGGINLKTIRLAASAGVDTFVAGTAIFDQPDRPEAIRQLRQAATETECIREDTDRTLRLD